MPQIDYCFEMVELQLTSQQYLQKLKPVESSKSSFQPRKALCRSLLVFQWNQLSTSDISDARAATLTSWEAATFVLKRRSCCSLWSSHFNHTQSCKYFLIGCWLFEPLCFGQKHTAWSLPRWICEIKIDTELGWPVQSPAIDLIHHLWDKTLTASQALSSNSVGPD